MSTTYLHNTSSFYDLNMQEIKARPAIVNRCAFGGA